MGKKRPATRRQSSKPPAERVEKPVVLDQQPKPKTRAIPKYRCCPICFEGRGGIGNAYSSKVRESGKRYYRCDTCNFTWSIKVVYSVHETIEVEHRNVTLETRD